MAKYPPYVNAYGNLSKLLEAIKKAGVPTKFNRDFISTVLGLKSSSYQATIPLFKRLGFIDPGSVPTQVYKDFRDETQSGHVMAKQIKAAYSDIFRANEYAHKLNKDQIISKLKTLLGVKEDDAVVPNVAGTFIELCKLADFGGAEKTVPKKETSSQEHPLLPKPEYMQPREIGISYTINLNLPATTDIEVFNAIFKSLKEHILNGK